MNFFVIPTQVLTLMIPILAMFVSNGIKYLFLVTCVSEPCKKPGALLVSFWKLKGSGMRSDYANGVESLHPINACFG